MNKQNKSVLITDLDNTLFDWVSIWFHSFGAMLDEIIKVSGLDRSKVESEIRAIHQEHGTSEYAFLIEEIPSVASMIGKEEVNAAYKTAIDAFRAQRRKHMKLYPSVAESLLSIKGSGALIVGYTESQAFYSNYRIRRLGLDGVLDHIFSPKDHDLPDGLSVDEIRKYPASDYKFKFTQHHYTPEKSLKPDPAVLRAIIDQIGADPDECVYVGDSRMKDIAMAEIVGITAAFAKYGEAHGTDEYELLKSVTHWTKEDVAREAKIVRKNVTPEITLVDSFGELFNYIEFSRFGGIRDGR